MRYKHEMVVNDIGQMVCRKVIGALIQHFIVKDVTFNHNLSTDKVVYNHVASRFYQEPDNIRRSRIKQRFHFLFGHRERIAHAATGRCIILEIGYLGTLSLKFVRCVKRVISLAGINKLFYVSAIDVAR